MKTMRMPENCILLLVLSTMPFCTACSDMIANQEEAGDPVTYGLLALRVGDPQCPVSGYL